MKIKKTWKNLAVLVFILPVRIPVVLIIWTIMKAGALAEAFGNWASDRLPGLDVDWAAEHAARAAKQKSDLLKLTQRMRKTSCSTD